jgi:hypothetical protein
MDAGGHRSLIYRAAVDYEHPYWDPDNKQPEYFLRLVNYILEPSARTGSRDMRVSPLRPGEVLPYLTGSSYEAHFEIALDRMITSLQRELGTPAARAASGR